MDVYNKNKLLCVFILFSMKLNNKNKLLKIKNVQKEAHDNSRSH